MRDGGRERVGERVQRTEIGRGRERGRERKREGEWEKDGVQETQ